jgi:hypothetical protein
MTRGVELLGAPATRPLQARHARAVGAALLTILRAPAARVLVAAMLGLGVAVVPLARGEYVRERRLAGSARQRSHVGGAHS